MIDQSPFLMEREKVLLYEKFEDDFSDILMFSVDHHTGLMSIVGINDKKIAGC